MKTSLRAPWCFGGPTQLVYPVYREDWLWLSAKIKTPFSSPQRFWDTLNEENTVAGVVLKVFTFLP